MRRFLAAVAVVVLTACGGAQDESPLPLVSEPTVTPEATTTEAPATTQLPTTTPETTRATVPPTAATSPPTTRRVSYSSCAEVRAAGKAPIRRGDPGYSTSLDRDGDGIACET